MIKFDNCVIKNNGTGMRIDDPNGVAKIEMTNSEISNNGTNVSLSVSSESEIEFINTQILNAVEKGIDIDYYNSIKFDDILNRIETESVSDVELEKLRAILKDLSNASTTDQIKEKLTNFSLSIGNSVMSGLLINEISKLLI